MGMKIFGLLWEEDEDDEDDDDGDDGLMERRRTFSVNNY